MNLYPFQEDGVRWLINNFRVILADEMGLGKTVQVTELMNRCLGISRALIVCPASLKQNWENEIRKWGRREYKIKTIFGKTPLPEKEYSFDGITVINYDILDAHIPYLTQIKWDLIAADEAQYLKSFNSIRSKRFLKYLIGSNRLVFITGSPVMNRPVEIWPLLYAINPKIPGSYIDFTRKFCGGRMVPGEGWKADGATNLDELHEKIKPVMLRRLKKNVLPQLPPKTREVITVGNLPGKLLKQNMENWRERLANPKGLGKPDELWLMNEISTQRRLDGINKASYVVAHVKMLLEAGQKVILFGWHKEVIKIFREIDPGCPVIVGETSLKERNKAVERFQNDENCRLIVGNIQSMGVGLTLTASSLVVFGELDWVPFQLMQAEDRAHRIGQKDNVHIQYLVAGGTIDEKMGPSLVKKMNHIDTIVDGQKQVETQVTTWFNEIKNFLLT